MSTETESIRKIQVSSDRSDLKMSWFVHWSSEVSAVASLGSMIVNGSPRKWAPNGTCWFLLKTHFSWNQNKQSMAMVVCSLWFCILNQKANFLKSISWHKDIFIYIIHIVRSALRHSTAWPLICSKWDCDPTLAVLRAEIIQVERHEIIFLSCQCRNITLSKCGLSRWSKSHVSQSFDFRVSPFRASPFN